MPKAEMIWKNYCPFSHPLYHNKNVYPKDVTKNGMRIPKRLQNFKIILSYIRGKKKRVLRGEQVSALSTKLEVIMGLAELLCFYSTCFFADFKPFSERPSIGHISQDPYFINCF